MRKGIARGQWRVAERVRKGSSAGIIAAHLARKGHGLS